MNDLAYKAIKSGGLQKLVDKRALQNEDLYKRLEKETAKRSTWNNFKIHFSRTYNELKDTVGTTQSAGYHAANAVQKHIV